jgi:hypothetical protein
MAVGEEQRRPRFRRPAVRKPEVALVEGPRPAIGRCSDAIRREELERIGELEPSRRGVAPGHPSAWPTGSGTTVRSARPTCTAVRRSDGFPDLDELTSAARKAFPGAAIYAGIDCLVIGR